MFTRKPHQPATIERVARLTAALLLSLSSLAPAIRPVAMGAIAGAAVGAVMGFRPPLLDPLLGAPKSAFAFDPNLPPGARKADYCYGLNDNGNIVVVFNRITATLANPGIAYTATLDGLDSGTNEGSTFDPATGIFYILDQNTSPDRLVEVSLLPGGFITVTEIGTGGLTTPTTPAAQPGIGIGLTGNEGAGRYHD